MATDVADELILLARGPASVRNSAVSDQSPKDPSVRIFGTLLYVGSLGFEERIRSDTLTR